MRPRTATIGSVSFNVSKKKSLPWGPHAAGAGSSLDHTEEGRDSPTTPTRKTSLFDSFRPRSKSDATRKLSHRRVPMVRPKPSHWRFWVRQDFFFKFCVRLCSKITVYELLFRDIHNRRRLIFPISDPQGLHFPCRRILIISWIFDKCSMLC